MHRELTSVYVLIIGILIQVGRSCCYGCISIIEVTFVLTVLSVPK